jgi:hypothetical protein
MALVPDKSAVEELAPASHAAYMYLPPVTIAYSQKEPITRQMAEMIERITQKITLRGLAAMLHLSVDGPQLDAGPLPLSVASAMPNATVAGINGEPGHTSADQARPCASRAHQQGRLR